MDSEQAGAAVYGAVFARELERLTTARIPLTVELVRKLDFMAVSAGGLAIAAREGMAGDGQDAASKNAMAIFMTVVGMNPLEDKPPDDG